MAAIVVFALVLRSEQMAERFGVLAGRAASRLLRLIRRPPVTGRELAAIKFRAGRSTWSGSAGLRSR